MNYIFHKQNNCNTRDFQSLSQNAILNIQSLFVNPKSHKTINCIGV